MTQGSQGGYYSMQCMCGWWHPSNLKPQSQWTEDDCKEQVKHQQFHLMQQAYGSYPSGETMKLGSSEPLGPRYDGTTMDK